MITNGDVAKARKYAIKAHGNQMYGEEFPYALHLQAVSSVLIRFGITDVDILCGGWLHDVLEDTETTEAELRTFFSDDTVDAVKALSEPKEGTRKEKHEIVYPQIARNWRSVIIKLADRIANVESGGRKTGMYVKEHTAFKHALKHAGRGESFAAKLWCSNLWNHLDELIIEATGK